VFFNGEKIRRILRISLCLECHIGINDPACRDYDPRRPCPVYREP
jgi:hypothetical protein